MLWSAIGRDLMEKGLRTVAKGEVAHVLDDILRAARPEPVAIAADGQPVAVLVPAATYARMAEADAEAGAERVLEEVITSPASRERLRAALQDGLDDLDAGAARPAADVLDELEAKYAAMVRQAGR